MKSLRKCISCGELKSRDEMIKITKDYKGSNAVINPNSLIFGRSVYLCYNQNCIDNAFKKNRINKALKSNAGVDKSQLQDLLTEYLKGTTDGKFKSQ